MYLTDKPTIHEIGYKTYAINCFGMQSPTLIVGEKRALLVDTGMGNCDLRGIVSGFVDRPLDVCLTHAHADHVAGIVQFERVFVPRKEIKGIQAYPEDFMQRFLDYFINLISSNDEIGCFKASHSGLGWSRLPEMLPMDDGFKFDLGGRSVTAYDCPTHTSGHMVFVDDRTKTLFAGDAVGSDNAGPANNPINPPMLVTLEEEVRGLENLLAHAAEYERIIPGHLGWGGDLSLITSVEPMVVEKLLSIGRSLMLGKLQIHKEKTEAMGDRLYGEEAGYKLYFLPG
jgi:hydroxyacylglutathione hydrolase